MWIFFFKSQKLCFLPEKSAQFKIQNCSATVFGLSHQTCSSRVFQYANFIIYISKSALRAYQQHVTIHISLLFCFSGVRPAPYQHSCWVCFALEWFQLYIICFLIFYKTSKIFKPLCQSSSSPHYRPKDLHQKLTFLSQIIPNFISIPCHKHTQGTIFTQN